MAERLLSKPMLLSLLAAVILFATFCLFTVSERQTAIRFRFGEIVESNYEPGLHVKWPYPINTVRKFDRWLQSLDTEPERFLTSEKKNVMVDSFVKWRIKDVRKFYTVVGGDTVRANLRLDQIIKDSLRSEFSKRLLKQVVSQERVAIMDNLTDVARREGEQLGIEVLDARIKRIDLPDEVSNSVFRRMRAEREQVARDFRSRGAADAERIRAEADRQNTVILAEAYRDAERLRGFGDARAAEIYAQAYNKNSDFYRFYRSMNAYRSSFGNPSDLIVLQPDSEFFKYFKSAMPAATPTH
jgi:membrane protease subunit HflC